MVSCVVTMVVVLEGELPFAVELALAVVVVGGFPFVVAFDIVEVPYAVAFPFVAAFDIVEACIVVVA